ncbi:MAG: DegV family protein [Dehalococcoidales bacterium]|nr:MAG: DegV family protein [Dehalococcoidales bacterium]
MTVKIVTDSLSDITEDNSGGLDITIVPLTVLFGRETYLDRVTITTEEFYHRLTTQDIVPTTTQPTPQAFADVYNRLAEETDEILVITLSSKLSGTYQSAMGAIEMMEKKCSVEVIDSQTVAMALGLVVLAATRAAQEGMKLDALVDFVHQALSRAHFLVYFDTLKYLAKGGRIGKAQGMLGSMLSIKPILTIKEGEISPVTRLRSQAAGTEYLYNFITSFQHVEALAVEHSTQPEIADRLVDRLSVSVPNVPIVRSVVSPVLGTYAGPNAIAVTVLEGTGI